MQPRLLLLAAVLAGVTACALAAATPEDSDVQLYVSPAASPSYASTLASLPSATVARMPDTSDPEDAAGRTLVFRTPASQALPKVFAQRLDSDTTLAAALMALIQVPRPCCPGQTAQVCVCRGRCVTLVGRSRPFHSCVSKHCTGLDRASWRYSHTSCLAVTPPAAADRGRRAPAVTQGPQDAVGRCTPPLSALCPDLAAAPNFTQESTACSMPVAAPLAWDTFAWPCRPRERAPVLFPTPAPVQVPAAPPQLQQPYAMHHSARLAAQDAKTCGARAEPHRAPGRAGARGASLCPSPADERRAAGRARARRPARTAGRCAGASAGALAARRANGHRAQPCPRGGCGCGGAERERGAARGPSVCRWGAALLGGAAERDHRAPAVRLRSWPGAVGVSPGRSHASQKAQGPEMSQL